MESFIILYFSSFEMEINSKYIVHLSPWPGLQRSPPFFCRSIVCVFPPSPLEDPSGRQPSHPRLASLSQGALTKIFSRLRSRVSGGKINTKHLPSSHHSHPQSQIKSEYENLSSWYFQKNFLLKKFKIVFLLNLYKLFAIISFL